MGVPLNHPFFIGFSYEIRLQLLGYHGYGNQGAKEIPGVGAADLQSIKDLGSSALRGKKRSCINDGTVANGLQPYGYVNGIQPIKKYQLF